MTLFWFACAAMVLLAFAFILPSLLRSKTYTENFSKELNISIARQRLVELERELAQGSISQEQFEAAAADFKKELLTDLQSDQDGPLHTKKKSKLPLAVILLGTPLLAVILYLQIGSVDLVKGVPSQQATQEQVPDIDEMVAKLEKRLQTEPGDVQGWIMLARSYSYLQRMEDAVKASATAYELAPDDVEVLVNYAAMLAQGNGGQLTGKPAEYIEVALKKDPRNPRSLFLWGHVKFQLREYRQAIQHWELLGRMLDPSSREYGQVFQAITLAKKELGEEPTPAAQPTSEKAIRVSVTLHEDLKSQASPDDALFVYARALNGPRMPLAVVKRTVADLPFELTLDDSMAMTPAMVMSKFSQVTVEARISKTGNALPQQGDLSGIVTPVSPGSSATINLSIDKIVP